MLGVFLSNTHLRSQMISSLLLRLAVWAITAGLAVAQNVGNGTKTKVLQGHINPDQVMTFVYAPFEVEPGVTSIYVLQEYSLKGNNSLDLGIFDERGYKVMGSDNGTDGFRGWSGGFRNNFTISPAGGATTPSYIGGPISPGTWNVVLGPYVVLPQGIDWKLTLTFGYDAVEDYYQYAYADIFRQLDSGQMGRRDEDDEYFWLRGDFHMHTIYSDGRYTPEQQIGNALNRSLDFIFFSEHNTYSGNAAMGAFEDIAGNLLIGRAIEVTTRHGHWQALGTEREQIIEWRYDPGSQPGYPDAAYQVHRSGGIVSVNHPYASCSRCDWGFDDWDHNDAIEVWNGATEANLNQKAIDKWHSLLVSGQRVTSIGGSDSHHPPSLNGLPTTVVKSRALSQSEILNAVKKGNAYIVEGPGMAIDFTVSTNRGRTYDMGDKISQNDARGAFVQFASQGFDGTRACFMTDRGYLRNETIRSRKDIRFPLPKEGMKFVRVEVRNSTDGLLGLSNPVYVAS